MVGVMVGGGMSQGSGKGKSGKGKMGKLVMIAPRKPPETTHAPPTPPHAPPESPTLTRLYERRQEIQRMSCHSVGSHSCILRRKSHRHSVSTPHPAVTTSPSRVVFLGRFRSRASMSLGLAVRPSPVPRPSGKPTPPLSPPRSFCSTTARTNATRTSASSADIAAPSWETRSGTWTATRRNQNNTRKLALSLPNVKRSSR